MIQIISILDHKNASSQIVAKNYNAQKNDPIICVVVFLGIN